MLPDLKHFSELCQLLLMGSDAILALSQPAHALRLVQQAGWRQALHQKCGPHTPLIQNKHLQRELTSCDASREQMACAQVP